MSIVLERDPTPDPGSASSSGGDAAAGAPPAAVVPVEDCLQGVQIAFHYFFAVAILDYICRHI